LEPCRGAFFPSFRVSRRGGAIVFSFFSSHAHARPTHPTQTKTSALAVGAVALGSKAAGLAKSGGLLSKLGLLGAGAATWAATSTTTGSTGAPAKEAPPPAPR
jgi:hypothetical protein